MKNFGFIADEIKPEDYTFGAMKFDYGNALQLDGQWDEFLPSTELQKKNGVETMNCTNYGTLNCIEILYRRLWGVDRNFSERYLGVMSGTTPNGNSPHKVAEVLRKEAGCIPESALPFNESVQSWEQYYSPNPMAAVFREMGQDWLDLIEFKHEWVFTSGTPEEKAELMKMALKFSPLGVSVRAWKKKNDLYVKARGAQDNHWCTVYGYVDGKHWKVFDHYDDTHKKLAWDYDFGYAKRYHIAKRTSARSAVGEVESLIGSVIDWFISLFKRIFT